MRICIVTDFFVPHYQGGGERRYYELLKRLAGKGHKIDLLCMRLAGVEDYEYIEGINVRHIGPIIKNPPERSAGNFLSFVLAASGWLLRHKYDLVEANTWVPLIPVSLFGRRGGARTTAVIHDLSSGSPDQWLKGHSLANLSEKLLVRLPFDRQLCVSNSVKERLTTEYGIPAKRIEVFYDGVDIKLIDSVKSGKRESNTIAYVGRLIPHKHVEDLIEVVRLLKKEIPSIRLKVIGGGQELESLKLLAKKQGLEKSIIFFGIVPEYKDLIRELKKSQLFVLPSTREGFGIVLVEAFACRIPAIAYRSDGVVEVIDDSLNGFLVRQRDVKTLAKKIKLLLINKKQANSFAKNGREKTEKLFNWDKIADELERFYLNLAGPR
jgi:glycosyltransferase involved in cell wall biosynthesis